MRAPGLHERPCLKTKIIQNIFRCHGRFTTPNEIWTDKSGNEATGFFFFLRPKNQRLNGSLHTFNGMKLS